MNRPPAHHNCRDQGPVRNTLPRINHIRQNRRAAAPRLPAGMGAGDPDDDAAVPLQAFFIRHWRFYRESTRDGRRHRRQSAGIRQASQTDQLGGRDRRADQAGAHRLVRRFAGRIRPPVPRDGRRRHVDAPQSGEAPQQLSRLLRSVRRGARRRPHLHLQRTQGRRRPDQQLDRAAPRCSATLRRRCSTAACAAARMYVVPFSMGPLGFAASRTSASSCPTQPICRGQACAS